MKLIKREFEKSGESNFIIKEVAEVERTVDTSVALETLIKARSNIMYGRMEIKRAIEMYNIDVDLMELANTELEMGIIGIPTKLNIEEMIWNYVEPHKKTLEEKLESVKDKKAK